MVNLVFCKNICLNYDENKVNFINIISSNQVSKNILNKYIFIYLYALLVEQDVREAYA